MVPGLCKLARPIHLQLSRIKLWEVISIYGNNISSRVNLDIGCQPKWKTNFEVRILKNIKIWHHRIIDLVLVGSNWSHQCLDKYAFHVFWESICTLNALF